ncbi:hydrolase fold protein [Rhodococcus phage Mbo2]|uniref:Hydrolase fold protein n=1 Tax=Rhodococcus phage Mbo2 TaxID=2936911 RepID=A0A9E7IGM5_9CAUD|nr:hydrolase fold protein [Rhodococcus phage Mbo2]
MTDDRTVILAAGGTGESYPGDVRTEVTGMLKNVTDHVDPNKFRVQWVGYDASYGNPTSYMISKTQLKARLRSLISYYRNCALLGYSQSADAMGELAADLVREGRGDWLKGLAFLGDPARHSRDYIGTRDPGGYGIVGMRGRESYGSIPLFQAANPGDPIPGASDDSLLRDIADFTPMFQVSDPVKSGLAVLDTLNSKGWQNYATHWWEWPVAWRRWNTAKAEANAYMPRIILPSGFVLNPSGGKHTDYANVSPKGFEKPFTTVIANYLNAL